MSNKKYRLLKDLPGLKSGSELRWSNNTGGYMYYDMAYNQRQRNYEDDMRDTFKRELVENNPDWFQEVVEPERIFVTQMYDLNNVYQTQCVRTGFETSAPIPEDKFPAIKQAIEKAINQPEFPTEEIKALTSLYRDMTDHIRQQKYTEADIYKARREGFEAARMNDIPTYATIEDYEKSLVK